MRFYRKIPDALPLVPGRPDVSIPGPWVLSSGWTCALVYVFLHAVLGIWFLCTARLGGEMAAIWLDTRVLGLSLFAVASLVNGSLLLLVLGSFVLTERKGRARDWKRVAALLFVLGLLGCTQAYLSGWKRTAEWDLERSVAAQESQAAAVRALRDELEGIGEHEWAGEYATLERGREVRLFLLPGSRAVFVHAPFEGRGAIEGLERSVSVEGGRLLVEQRRRGDRVRYAVVERGERRYLVMEGRLADFLAQTGEPAALYPAVYLRAGDERAPLGAARLVDDLTTGR